MVVARNNFSGGPDGTTITTSNSGQYGDALFDVANSSGTGNVLQFANTGAAALSRPTAEYVMHMKTGSTGVNPSVAWNSNTISNDVQYWTRFYAYFSAVGGNATDLCLFWFSSSGSVDCASVWLRNTATPYCLYIKAGSGTKTYMSSTPLNSGEWIRVEFRATANIISGSSDLYLYQGPDTDGVNYTDTVSQTSQNYQTNNINYAMLGQAIAFGGQANTPDVYFSGWEVNNTGYPGPAPFRQGLGVPMNNQPNPVAIHMT